MEKKIGDIIVGYYLTGRKLTFLKKYNKTYILHYKYRANIQALFVLFTVFYIFYALSHPNFSTLPYKVFATIYLVFDLTYLCKNLEVKEGKVDGAEYSFRLMYQGFIMTWINLLTFLYIIGEIS